MKHSNDSLQRQVCKKTAANRLKKMLYADIALADQITPIPVDRNYMVLQLITNNSIHNISHPYVTYYVRRRDHKLIRLESAESINLPVPAEKIYTIAADAIANDVTDFVCYKTAYDDNASSQTAQNGKKLPLRGILPGAPSSRMEMEANSAKSDSNSTKSDMIEAKESLTLLFLNSKNLGKFVFEFGI